MNDKLLKLYNECIVELKSIGIDFNNSIVENIDIKISKRNNKRYGVCKQEDPDLSTIHKTRKGNNIYIKYDKFNKHHIEISKWVMQLDDSIIKNTIIHELIHCLPYCNNHSTVFKKYASLINEKLNYNITTVGNKKEDYEKSNIEYVEEDKKFKYKIICLKCGKEYMRIRKPSNLRKYRCGICKGKLKLEVL